MSMVKSVSIGAFSCTVVTLLILSSGSAANPLFDEPSFVYDVYAPYLCETADFNCDGNMDFLVTSYDPPAFYVFLGAGDGTFFFNQQTVPLKIGSVSICHLNDDLYPDLVVGDGMYEQTIRVYLGDGSGGFQQQEIINHDHYSVNTGDLDGDGDSDLLIPYNVTSHYWIDVYLCDGEGSFVADSSYEVEENGFVHLVSIPGDLNGDGFADVAYVPWGMSRLGIMLGNGDGTLQPEYFCGDSYYSCDVWSTIAEGDFNEDGYLDLAATSGKGWAEDLVLVNDGSGVFTTSDSLGNPFAWATAGDFDLDGHLDLAGSDAYLKIYKGWGDGSFGEAICSYYPNSGQLGAADFDNDGDLDLVRLNDSVYVYLNKTIQQGIGEQEESALLSFLSASPNPFRNSLSISVQDVSDAALISIQVFDLYGREVTLVPVDGEGSAVWNGEDSAGIEVPSGVYMLKPLGECSEATLLVLKL